MFVVFFVVFVFFFAWFEIFCQYEQTSLIRMCTVGVLVLVLVLCVLCCTVGVFVLVGKEKEQED